MRTTILIPIAALVIAGAATAVGERGARADESQAGQCQTDRQDLP
ncbi:MULTISPECIES: hypothetical protein [Mycolicibacterium]|nr:MULTISPECIES: hypothetical protein [Mycolicibacterium]